MTAVKKGDRYVWPENEPTVDIEITRVARDGSWADIHCRAPRTSWTKRQKLPFPASFRPQGGAS